MNGCPGHQRHWFTMSAKRAGGTGVRTPRCVRCGLPNPTILTSDDWLALRELEWDGLTEGEKTWIDEMVSEGWPEGH